MIEVELRRVPEGEDRYRAVATLRVFDDGSHRLEDPDNLFFLDMPVLVPEGGTLREVHFDQEPATWARNLGSRLRTGYLVPVITRDTEDPHG